ncbi:TRAP transporter substrate-binding protein [Azospirillum sp. RWY-5-1]|uniref:TRAP transporter substrate-binding protein n=1 Tax=Azospirillum oleiclasticum TaxID=2735135 RepID=A0ABX2TJ62_9PROT|nr:TRAP transporter substrate-binding protein [Azospirillum oleiclasticum]NYZ14520.1 TRAP transporter substrate-binding protein [Azospirillum oleiclasticum]NYZ24298.1 TRAP transporter substrate-binding protein [Azospirillum oleiclasticum]
MRATRTDTHTPGSGRAPRARRLLALSVGAALAAFTLPASAQTLPETSIRVIGNFSSQVQVQKVEKPFWTQEIPADSGGRITVTYNNYDIMGIREQQMIRLSEAGVADFASTDIVKLAGDDPVFEGCDLIGIAPDLPTARKACDAWAPVVAEAMERKFQTKLLGLAPNPGLVFWCRSPVKNLADFAGKKVRVNSRTMADMVTTLGGTPITTPFGEVVPSLQRGVFDCAITGSLTGNTAGWSEVTKYLFPLPVNWSIYYQSANLNSWKKYSPELQKFLEAKFADLNERLWTIAAQAHAEGVSCNTGKDPCTLGKKAGMELVAVGDEDRTLLRKISQEVVLVQWGKRCGKACATKWNDTVGKAVGLSIPLDKI